MSSQRGSLTPGAWRRAVFALALGMASTPVAMLRAQDSRPVRLNVILAPDTGSRGSRVPVVRSENLLATDSRWLSALRSGLPVRLHYRLEIWRSREGWFDTFDRQVEWDVLVRHEPLLDQYTMLTLVGNQQQSAGTPRSMPSAPHWPSRTRSTSDPTRRATTTTPHRCRSLPCRIRIWMSSNDFSAEILRRQLAVMGASEVPSDEGQPGFCYVLRDCRA